MQDRCTETDLLGKRRIGVQRIAIAVQTVQQRLIRAGLKRAFEVRGAIGNRVGDWAGAGRTAETTITAGEGRAGLGE